MRYGAKVLTGVSLALGLMILTTGCATMMAWKYGGDRVFVKSEYAFDETVSRVKRTIESKQMMVVFTADHQAMLSMVGMNTKGMQGIEFFHPRYGKVIMQNDQPAGIELPLRLVVMETPDGKAMLTYYRPSSVFAKYKGLDGMAAELEGVFEAIVVAVSR